MPVNPCRAALRRKVALGARGQSGWLRFYGLPIVRVVFAESFPASGPDLLALASANLSVAGPPDAIRDLLLNRFEDYLQRQKNSNGKPDTGNGHAD